MGRSNRNGEGVRISCRKMRHSASVRVRLIDKMLTVNFHFLGFGMHLYEPNFLSILNF